MPNDRAESSNSLTIGTGTPIGEVSPQFANQFYHQPIFYHFGNIYKGRIREALHEKPVAFHRKEFLPHLSPGREYRGEEGWNICRTYLDAIENQMAQVLRRHSVFFWIHLYRRIGVELSPEHGGKIDPNTVGLVRHIVELAISKHADNVRDDDVAAVSYVHFKDILDGHYQRLFQKHLGPRNALRTFRKLATTGQWVIKQFELRDFVDMYLVEGYAYEY